MADRLSAGDEAAVRTDQEAHDEYVKRRIREILEDKRPMEERPGMISLEELQLIADGRGTWPKRP